MTTKKSKTQPNVTFLAFTAEEVQANERLAAIDLTQISLNAVRWREHRRLNPTYTMIAVADINSTTGTYYCYAGDALRLSRLTKLDFYTCIFGGKKVEVLGFPIARVAKHIKTLNKANINICFIA